MNKAAEDRTKELFFFLSAPHKSREDAQGENLFADVLTQFEDVELHMRSVDVTARSVSAQT